jgi:hypothetical protein
MIQVNNCKRFQPKSWLRILLKWRVLSTMRSLQLLIHISFGDLLHSLLILPHQSTAYDIKGQVHVHVCVLVIDRSRGENYYVMAVALVQCIWKECNRSSWSVRQTAPWESPFHTGADACYSVDSHVQPYNTFSSFCTLRLPGQRVR